MGIRFFTNVLFNSPCSLGLVKKGLNIGFWAFSFGLASLANGAVSFVHHHVLSGLANGAFIFANLMIERVGADDIRKALQRTILVKIA